MFVLSHGAVIIHQNALARPFQIVELAVFSGPPERDANAQCDDHTQRNQENQYFQNLPYLRVRRSEFATTTRELVAMPMAAQAGEIFPIIASGMASAL